MRQKQFHGFCGARFDLPGEQPLIDYQNIGGPTKDVLDALVEYGWPRGDCPKDELEFSTPRRESASLMKRRTVNLG